MSYILDAIRKSDMQRQRGAAPTLLTSHEPSVTPRRAMPVVYWILAVALLIVGVAIGWLRPWQANPAPVVPAAGNVAAPPPAVPGLLPPVAPPELLRRVEREPAAAKPPAAPPVSAVSTALSPVPAPVATPAPAPAIALPAPAPVAPAATAIAPAPVPAVVAAGTAKAVPEAAPESKIINFADLPSNIRDEIPRMSIAVHAYSREPKNRLVTIDNRLLHEGDDAGPGIRLEQITPDGMVFNYKGYRFRRSVQDVVNNR
jgi:general secretion pathway protein B